MYIAIIIKNSKSFVLYKILQKTFYFINCIQYSRTSIDMRLTTKTLAWKNPQKNLIALENFLYLLSEFKNSSTKNNIITNSRYFDTRELQDLQSAYFKKICVTFPFQSQKLTLILFENLDYPKASYTNKKTVLYNALHVPCRTKTIVGGVMICIGKNF